MILKALNDYYDALSARGEITPPGWSETKVSYALNIDENGVLRGVRSLKIMSPDGKKELPQKMQVPEQCKKASGIISNFLCENSSYLLGIDDKDKPERSVRCFEAAKALHHEILDGVDSPEADAVLKFFDSWDPASAAEDPVVSPYLKDLVRGSWIVFVYDGEYVHNYPKVRAAWHSYRSAGTAKADTGICLVTGKHGAVARLHPAIKGIKDAQSSGASLVSFNESASESYGHVQGMNSPVTEEAAFAYGTALNHLISDKKHLQYIADTAVVFWAEDAEPLCQDIFSCAVFGGDTDLINDDDIKGVISALAKGISVDLNGKTIDPDNNFYVLGLAPNAARLSVRFFLCNTFGKMLSNVVAHSERLQIVKPAYISDGSLPLWRILGETVNRNEKKKQASPPMTGSVVRSILSDTAYPATLFEQTMMRIRAERSVTYGRAAILKAFFIKNVGYNVPKEVLKVELNEESACLPYVLGRLFAVLESVQRNANPNITATIRDKYFNSACATPATIFPLLTKLSQSHLRKLEAGKRIHYEKLIRSLECKINTTLPARLSLADQGTFHLGYYHQNQKIFEKTEKSKGEN